MISLLQNVGCKGKKIQYPYINNESLLAQFGIYLPIPQCKKYVGFCNSNILMNMQFILMTAGRERKLLVNNQLLIVERILGLMLVGTLKQQANKQTTKADAFFPTDILVESCTQFHFWKKFLTYQISWFLIQEYKHVLYASLVNGEKNLSDKPHDFSAYS